MLTDRVWLLYDGRACNADGGAEDTDDCIVLVSCDSDREARGYAGDYGAMACYSYRFAGNVADEERWEWDWTPETGFVVAAAPPGEAAPEREEGP